MRTEKDSRRERKKRATHDTIAAAARRLFAERGFEAVTVAEIARAADVAEKTVFNHFATKEHLAFAGREQRLDVLLARIAERPTGTPVLAVFRATTAEMIDDLVSGGDDEALAVRRIILASKALRERLTTGWEEEATALTAVIGGTAGAAAGDVIPAVVGRTLVWTHRTILRMALTGLVNDEDRQALAARLRVAADLAYDQLAAGLGEYGAGRPGG